MLHQPHPNWSDEWNAAEIDSDLQGGVWLDKVLVGTKLTVDMASGWYEIERREDGFYLQEFQYSGTSQYAPIPVKVVIQGSIYSPYGSCLKMKFIGRGMFMEWSTEHHRRLISKEVLELTEARPCVESSHPLLHKACALIKRIATSMLQAWKVLFSLWLTDTEAMNAPNTLPGKTLGF